MTPDRRPYKVDVPLFIDDFNDAKTIAQPDDEDPYMPDENDEGQ